MIKSLLVCLMTCMISSITFAEIIETDSIYEAIGNAKPGDLVLLDLDNTVFQLKHMAGTDQWFEHFLKEARNFTDLASLAHETTRSIFIEIHNLTNVHPVEEETPSLIYELQKNNVLAIALTARPLRYLNMTLRQLKELDIDFTRSPIPDVPNQLSDLAMFHEGVIFTGGSHKGEALTYFLDFARMRPDRVIMVDDKAKNLDDIGYSMNQRKIPTELWRYNRTDADIESFDPHIAKIQVDHLHTGRVISDHEARLLLPHYQLKQKHPEAYICRELFNF